ncbi:MAG: hypothetical protein ACLTWR_02565 [Agathobaculum desmolans]|uniref:hypothetical protein n=1 Tax=Agathobaculum desmolans TaxID=39484 RepID=UPI003995B8C8
MSFEPQKLSTFSKKIVDLADQPNMQPHELKEYFDSSPEELRQSHNGLCDALTAKTAASALGFSRTAGVPADTVQAAVENVQQQLDAAVMGNIPSGSVTGDKLAQDVRDRFTAIENAAKSEASTRASGDSNLQSQINTHTTQISSLTATECEVVFGSYVGDGTESRTIALGFQPRAVFVIPQSGQMFFDNIQTQKGYGGLAMPGLPCFEDERYPHIQIISNGFSVFFRQKTITGNNCTARTNEQYRKYFYIAFKA